MNDEPEVNFEMLHAAFLLNKPQVVTKEEATQAQEAFEMGADFYLKLARQPVITLDLYSSFESPWEFSQRLR